MKRRDRRRVRSLFSNVHAVASSFRQQFGMIFGTTETLENRALLSNLAISQARLIDGQSNPIADPILGERLEIRANYSTTGLTASDVYAIRVVVDGVAIDRTSVTFGAGVISGSWFADIRHGFAESGIHTVQVTLDPMNQIVEDNESDNTASFTFTSVQAPNFPARLKPFVEGGAGVDWRITNFADLDPRPGVLRDYRGGQFTYDTASFGHDAIDLGPATFAAADRGVKILAAAAGTVVDIHDGEFDRNTAFTASPLPANYIVIDLGNGWQTRYWHLRRDSVSVRIGDVVKAGDFLGFIGSSGFSTGPHVHFEVTWRSHSVETMLDPATFWDTPPAYPAEYRHALKAGFSSQVPLDSDWNELPENMSVFLRGDRVHFWVIAGAQLPNDTRTVRFLRPDGTLYFEQTNHQGSAFYASSQWYYYITLPADAPLGTWTAVWLQNNVELARNRFDVALNGVPEIRVEQGTNLIRDQRFTPIDFGTAVPGSTAPVRSFSIHNQGSAPLTLGAIRLPAGYELAVAPSATVAPGQSTHMDIRLASTVAGYFSGELQLTTNDPDESEFRIWVEGQVQGTESGTLIPGISVRSAPEGSRLYANIRRTGSAAGALTVNLQSSDTTELAVPQTITFPAGSAFVNFEIQAVPDLIDDGSQRVRFTASAPGVASGQNEVTVSNQFAGQLLVTETAEGTAVSESGQTDEVSVVLSGPPASDVVIDITSSDSSQVITAESSLRFSPSNWSIPQIVTVRGQNDMLSDGTQTATLKFSVRQSSSDAAFQIAPDVNISATVTDDDSAGFEIDNTGGSAITREQAFSDQLRIRLTAQPLSTVVLRLLNPDAADLSITPPALTFDPQKWNVWQSVTLSAVADGVTDGDHERVITASISDPESDDSFDAVPDQAVTVVTEDVQSEFWLTESSGITQVREGGASDSISILLTARPVQPVVVRVQMPLSQDVSLSQSAWTFDSTNWNVPQTLTVTAVDDLLEESGESVALTFSVDPDLSDAAFRSSPSWQISVGVLDNEPGPPALTVPSTALLNSAVTLTWTPVDEVVDYEVWVNFITGGVARVVHTRVRDSSLTVPGFSEMGVYRIWVRAAVSTGFSTRWSAPQDLRVSGRVVLNSLPRYLDSNTPAFSWKPVSGAVRYDLWVDDVLNARSQIIRRTDLTSAAFQAATPLSMSLYRVWVRAVDQRGQMTPWSERAEFFVAPRPDTSATALSTFDSTPTIRWNAVNGARSYEIWIRSGYTSADVYRVSSLTQTDWTPPEPLQSGRYQWWVRAIGSHAVTGLWSLARDLWVGGQPVLLAPVIKPDRKVNFRWAAVEGAFSYQLQVDRIDQKQVRVLRNDALSGTSWEPSVPLPVGIFRVWMRAVSAAGEVSFWSHAVDFVVT